MLLPDSHDARSGHSPAHGQGGNANVAFFPPLQDLHPEIVDRRLPKGLVRRTHMYLVPDDVLSPAAQDAAAGIGVRRGRKPPPFVAEDAGQGGDASGASTPGGLVRTHAVKLPGSMRHTREVALTAPRGQMGSGAPVQPPRIPPVTLMQSQMLPTAPPSKSHAVPRRAGAPGGTDPN